MCDMVDVGMCCWKELNVSGMCDMVDVGMCCWKEWNVSGMCEGLKSHPQYELARLQMRGYSGMVTFYIKGGEHEARVFLSNLKVI